jgi:hypothetical protein
MASKLLLRLSSLIFFFVDDVLILGIGNFEDWMAFQSILTKFLSSHRYGC